MGIINNIRLLMAGRELYNNLRRVADENKNLQREVKRMGLINWILERLSEPSTWRGLIAAATAVGVSIDPTMADKIIGAGVALIGLVEVIRRERKKA